MDMKELKDIVKANIEDRYDHKNLYLDVDDFSDMNPSAENIAVKIWNILRGIIDPKFELSVVLYETERNFVEYDGKD
jgi:6-pyruvoyltetrahydropterin/6-carboxytetrahydropterin synthase